MRTPARQNVNSVERGRTSSTLISHFGLTGLGSPHSSVNHVASIMHTTVIGRGVSLVGTMEARNVCISSENQLKSRYITHIHTLIECGLAMKSNHNAKYVGLSKRVSMHVT